jgi:uncharacterized membrane protein YedE/YeeE
MKNNLAVFFVGLIFALGLGISGMTRPEKVIGFLDVFGNWDPSLMFVMGSSILIHLISYRIILKRQSPLLTSTWNLPQNKNITSSLIAGSALFGMGWGLAGYCPGPSITSLATFQFQPLIFVLSMISGMLLFKWIDKFIKFKR